MNYKVNFILLEFEYEYTYLHEYCNRLKRTLTNVFSNFDEESDVNECLRFTDEQESKIVQITPVKSGIMFYLTKDHSEIQEFLSEASIEFNKLFNTVCSILQIENNLKDISIGIKYESYELHDKVREKLITNILSDRNKGVLGVGVLIDNKVEDGKKYLRINNEGESTTILVAKSYDKNINTIDVNKEAIKIMDEGEKFINEILS